MVHLTVERVELPGGGERELEIIRHVGAAAVVPVTAEGDVLLVRQYRHAVGGWLLEVPAGKLDPGESPEDCARRETEEEVGFRPGLLEPLGRMWTTPGFTDEAIWLFLGRQLVPGRQDLQEDEVLEVVRMPLEDALAAAESGAIEDGKSICALFRAASRWRASKEAATDAAP